MSEELNVIKERRRERRSASVRWAYVILAVFNTLLFVLMGLFVIKYVGTNDQAFCELLHALTPTAAPALPPHPTEVQIKQHDNYLIVLRLDHRLGCI